MAAEDRSLRDNLIRPFRVVAEKVEAAVVAATSVEATDVTANTVETTDLAVTGSVTQQLIVDGDIEPSGDLHMGGWLYGNNADFDTIYGPNGNLYLDYSDHHVMVTDSGNSIVWSLDGAGHQNTRGKDIYNVGTFKGDHINLEWGITFTAPVDVSTISSPDDGEARVDGGFNTSTNRTLCIYDGSTGQWIPQNGDPAFS